MELSKGPPHSRNHFPIQPQIVLNWMYPGTYSWGREAAGSRLEVGPASMTSWCTLHIPVSRSRLNETFLHFSNLPDLHLPLSLCTCYSLCLRRSSPASFSPHGSHFNVTFSEKPACPSKFKVAAYFLCLLISHILFLREKKDLIALVTS